MLVSHESPVCLFEASQSYNDFEYALAPSVIDNEAYRNFYRSQSDKGRMVWLDTGVFEEGVPRSDEELIWCMDQINPTHIICPDILKDKDATIEGYKRFKDKLDRDIKLVVVAQGETEKAFIECFEYFTNEDDVDTVCIPHNLHYYDRFLCNSSQKYVLARQMMVEMLYARHGSYQNYSKKVHLLGCSDPIELRRYAEYEYDFITSIDTSSPIIHGIYGQRYTDNGLPCEKIRQLLIELLDANLNSNQIECIMYNVSKFKDFTKGE